MTFRMTSLRVIGCYKRRERATVKINTRTKQRHFFPLQQS
ncbi:hypothetical protein EGK_05500, partial [Macaca mulatta]